jgi:membrane protein implicated in regulation of membrane protease activity
VNISHQEIWLIIGIGCLIIEVLSGGFWVVFLGMGGLMTSLLSWLGILNGLNEEIGAFVVFSFSLLLLRKPIMKKLNTVPAAKHLGDSSGHMLHVTKEIPPGGQGQVEFQGSPWEAFSDENAVLPVGSKVKVVRQEGLKLCVKKVDIK